MVVGKNATFRYRAMNSVRCSFPCDADYLVTSERATEK